MDADGDRWVKLVEYKKSGGVDLSLFRSCFETKLSKIRLLAYLAGTSDRKELLSGAIDILQSQTFRRARMREFG